MRQNHLAGWAVARLRPTIFFPLLLMILGLGMTAPPAWAQSTLEYALICAANPSACPSTIGGTCQNIVSAEFVGTLCSSSSQQSFRGNTFLTDGGLLDTTTSGDAIQTYVSSDGSTYHFKRGLLKTSTFTGRIYQIESRRRSVLNGAISTSSELVLNGVEQLQDGGVLDTTDTGAAGYYVRRYVNADGSGRYIRRGLMRTPTFDGIIYQTEAKEKDTNGTLVSWNDTTLNGVEQLPEGGTLDTRNTGAGHYVRRYTSADSSSRYIRYGVLKTATFQGVIHQTEAKEMFRGVLTPWSEMVMDGIEQLPEGGTLDTTQAGFYIRRYVQLDGSEYYIKNGLVKSPVFEGLVYESKMDLVVNGVKQTVNYVAQSGLWRIGAGKTLKGVVGRLDSSNGTVRIFDDRVIVP